MTYKHTTLFSSEFSQFPHQTSLLSPAGIFLHLCSTYFDKPRFDLFWGLWVPGTPHPHHFRDHCLHFPLGCPPSRFLPKGHTFLLHAAFTSSLSALRQDKADTSQQDVFHAFCRFPTPIGKAPQQTWATWKWQNLPKGCSQVCMPVATREYKGFLRILPKGILMGERWVKEKAYQSASTQVTK